MSHSTDVAASEKIGVWAQRVALRSLSDDP